MNEKMYQLGQNVKFVGGSKEEPQVDICTITDIIKDEDGNYLYQLDHADYMYDFEIEPISGEEDYILGIDSEIKSAMNHYEFEHENSDSNEWDDGYGDMCEQNLRNDLHMIYNRAVDRGVEIAKIESVFEQNDALEYIN